MGGDDFSAPKGPWLFAGGILFAVGALLFFSLRPGLPGPTSGAPAENRLFEVIHARMLCGEEPPHPARYVAVRSALDSDSSQAFFVTDICRSRERCEAFLTSTEVLNRKGRWALAGNGLLDLGGIAETTVWLMEEETGFQAMNALQTDDPCRGAFDTFHLDSLQRDPAVLTRVVEEAHCENDNVKHRCRSGTAMTLRPAASGP
jgi:hypothetical protein